MPKKLINSLVSSSASDETDILKIDFEGIDIELVGFQPKEYIKISQPTWREAFCVLGKASRRSTLRELSRVKKRKKIRALASASLDELKKWDKKKADFFTTSDGVNHLNKYLEALSGYAEGSGMTEVEAAWQQIADDVSCQTLLVQNLDSGEVGGMHTEEDSLSYNKYGEPSFGKKWVDIEVGNQRAFFCSYPGVFDWGVTPTVMVNEGKTIFQTADAITPAGSGPLWVNAVAFMVADCASPSFVKELIKKLIDLPKPIFRGGYILHEVFCEKKPELLTLECGYNIAEFIGAKKISGSIITFGVGSPSTKELADRDEYHHKKRDDETFGEYRLRKSEGLAMERRKVRLLEMGEKIIQEGGKKSWSKEFIYEQTKQLVIENKGDWVDDWYTGLINALVTHYAIVYVGPGGKLSLKIVKHESGKKLV